MPHTLSFNGRIDYSDALDGIKLPVALAYGDLSISLIAKVDTGASFCIFDRSHGEALGLVIEQGIFQEFGTVQGSFRAYGHRVTIETSGFEFETAVFFAEFDGFGKNVLGRRGWLDMLRVGIVDYDRELYLDWY
jgi:hypothetical protein